MASCFWDWGKDTYKACDLAYEDPSTEVLEASQKQPLSDFVRVSLPQGESQQLEGKDTTEVFL